MGALDGMLVVTLEQAVAAPVCTSRLADAGARVIKIERADGDFARNYDHVAHGESAYFVWANRGKESVVLDIKNEDDARVLHAIVQKADVFVQNLAPGAAARAGFGADEMRKQNPRLVTCDISGYGEEGDYAQMKAYDLLVQAESGLVSISGAPGDYGRIGVSICDIGTGLVAFGGIMTALLERERTGVARGLRISLFDVTADWMAVPLLHFDYAGKAPERPGLKHPSIAPYGGYPTRDGGIIVISIQNEREWARFCAEVMGDAAMATDARFASNTERVKNRDVLDGRVAALFLARDRADMAARLRAADIAFGAVNSVAELSAHPALRRWTVETETGPVNIPASPFRFSDVTDRPGPVPALGANTDAVRREFLEGDG